MIAGRTGEKNKSAAASAAGQAILISFIVIILISTGGLFFAADILKLMGASDAVVREGTVFTQIMFSGCFFVVLLFVINGVFRGAGSAAMAMKSLWLASLLNILLCPLLVHFYGLKGAAIATVTGRFAGVLYQCWHLLKGQTMIPILREDLRIQWSLIRHLIRIAWPASFQFINASGSWIILSALIARYGGTSASAGYQIAMRNIIFFILPAWGLSNAAATLVGQNLGAGKPERAEQNVRLCAIYNGIFVALVTMAFLIFAHPIVSFFTTEQAVKSAGILALRIIGSGFVFYGLGMVMTQALNGAGDTRTPTVINIVCFWLFHVPLAWYLCTSARWNTTGVFLAIPLAESLIAILAFFYFKKGKWKLQKV